MGNYVFQIWKESTEGTARVPIVVNTLVPRLWIFVSFDLSQYEHQMRVYGEI